MIVAFWFIRLAELMEDWSYMIQREGWRSGLPAVGQELARLPYRRMRFVVLARSLLDPLPDVRPKIVLEVREFEVPDVELVRQIDRPSEAKLCAQRLARGHRGFLALHKGQPVGHAWASGAVDPELERVHLQLEPGDMFCSDFYTPPAFRGLGIQTALALAQFRLFRDLGYHKAIAYVETRNQPSLAVFQRKLGGQIVDHLDFVRIGPWRWVSSG